MKTYEEIFSEVQRFFDELNDSENRGGTFDEISRDFGFTLNEYFSKKYGIVCSQWPANKETIAYHIINSTFTGDPIDPEFLKKAGIYN